MRAKHLFTLLVVTLITFSVGCSSKRAENVSAKDSVKNSLAQADLKDVTVDEDSDKNLITLGGTVHSDDAKARAGEVAKSAAGKRVIANQISVRPVGAESEAKSIASNLDDGIENNYKAALISSGLNKQHIRYDAKNGVLTLKGSVETTTQRHQAEQVAASVPNVQQVVNEIEVKR